MLPAFLLALIAGYADTIGYLRYEAFAGLMTGNTIFFGVEVARGQWLDAAYPGESLESIQAAPRRMSAR